VIFFIELFNRKFFLTGVAESRRPLFGLLLQIAFLASPAIVLKISPWQQRSATFTLDHVIVGTFKILIYTVLYFRLCLSIAFILASFMHLLTDAREADLLMDVVSLFLGQVAAT